MKNLHPSIKALVISVALIFATPATADFEIKLDFDQKPVLTSHQERELHCLAQNIYYEAGAESYDGKLAVAQVTVNRTRHTNFPNTVCEVVKQKSVRKGRAVCQFSWFCTSKSKHRLPVNSKNYQESLLAARQVFVDGLEVHGLKNALYFCTTHLHPGKDKIKVAKVGNHNFYRDRHSVI